MNYALDALWWRLTDPHVRALASLLTAPALWQHPQALPIPVLLGKQGFRYLLALDEQPAVLHQALASTFPHQHRLGAYAEDLFKFWLSHAPHCRLLAHNVPLRDEHQQTLGALDFLVQIEQQLYHVELCCKYYGGDEMVGLNRQDSLSKKVAKLNQQLALIQHPVAQTYLREQGMMPSSVKSVAVIRGMAFVSPTMLLPAPLHPYAWQGLYVQDWADYPLDAQGHYHVLHKMDYLAPARVDETQLHDAKQVATLENGMVAVLERRPDGFWHEIQRIMFQP